MVHPGCGMNGGGESNTEGEQYRVSMMTLDLPVGKPKCVIPIDGQHASKGAPGARRRNIWFFRTFFTFHFGGTYIPFVFLLLGIPEEGGEWSGYLEKEKKNEKQQLSKIGVRGISCFVHI